MDDRPNREAGEIGDGGVRLILVAVCALVDVDGRLLVQRRPEGKPMAGLWEFPGGKLEPGERPEDALVRELSEELAVTVTPPCLAPLTFASHPLGDAHLLLPLYICRRWEGTPRALEGQEIRWIRASRLRTLEMPPADEPLIPHLIDLLG